MKSAWRNFSKSSFGLVPLRGQHLSCGEASSWAPPCFPLHPLLCFFLWFVALHDCLVFFKPGYIFLHSPLAGAELNSRRIKPHKRFSLPPFHPGLGLQRQSWAIFDICCPQQPGGQAQPCSWAQCGCHPWGRALSHWGRWQLQAAAQSLTIC